MLGKPIPDWGSGGTSVRSFSLGTRLSGGLRLSVDHSSSAIHSARWVAFELSGFCGCWQAPAPGGVPGPWGLFAVPCCMLDIRKLRAYLESCRSCRPVGSVCSSEAAFTQYSFDE